MFSPTPLDSCSRATPAFCSTAPWPTPDTSSSCGEATEPAARITSALARAVRLAPFWMNSTPAARLPSNRTRVAWAHFSTLRFGRFIAWWR